LIISVACAAAAGTCLCEKLVGLGGSSMKITVGFLDRFPERMSIATRTMLLIAIVMLILLIGNYVFAERLYAYSFDPSWSRGTFNFRGSDAAEWFAFPEDRIGAVLLVLFIACFVAFIRQLKSDIGETTKR
jgi:hypothetical protein